YSCFPLLSLHSFPTRRSSDLFSRTASLPGASNEREGLCCAAKKIVFVFVWRNPCGQHASELDLRDQLQNARGPHAADGAEPKLVDQISARIVRQARNRRVR